MYKRIWDKARQDRPSIYGRPGQNPFERYASHKTTIPYHKLASLYLDLLRRARPSQQLDLQELLRVLSYSFRGQDGSHTGRAKLAFENSTVGGLVPIHSVVSLGVFIRSLLISEGIAERDANLLSLATLYFFFNSGEHTRGIFLEDNVGEDAAHRLLLASRIAKGMKTITGMARFSQTSYTQKLSSLLEQYLSLEIPISMPTGSLPGEVADCLAFPFLRPSEPKYDMVWGLPFFPQHLVAAADLDAVRWFINEEGRLISLPSPNSSAAPNFSGRSIAFIAVYPWEADYLEKANELLRRGIPTMEPIGSTFAGDVELAMFRWVCGTRLDHSLDPCFWREYGRVLRLANERGVGVDDAAGRNAMVSSHGVFILDLEHVWFTPDGRPLTNDERAVGLNRLKNEVGDLGFFDPLMRGYQS